MDEFNESDFSEEQEGGEAVERTIMHLQNLINGNIMTLVDYPHAISKAPSDSIVDIFKLFHENLVKHPDLIKYDREITRMLGDQIFNGVDYDLIKENLAQRNISFDTVCGKFISEGEIFFRCLDCDLLKQKSTFIYALLCPDCFDHSNHVGHRILYELSDGSSSPICDCGDPYALVEKGFCSNHRNIQVDPESILKLFPEKSLEICVNSLVKAFYGLIATYELAIRSPLEYSDQNRFHSIGSIFCSELLSFCEGLYGEINSGFLLILIKVFQSNFLSDFSLVWHDCNDIRNDMGDWSLNPDQPHQCTCSVLENILRLSNIIDRENQGAIHKILIECAKEPSFKLYLQNRFIKFMPYMYSQSYNNNDPEDHINSRILSIKVQMFGSEELCAHALDSEYFYNHLHCLKRVVLDASVISYEMYHTCIDLAIGVGYFLNDKYSIGKRTIDQQNLIQELLEISLQFQTKFFYSEKFHLMLHAHEIDFISLNCGLMANRALVDIIENILRSVLSFDDETKVLYIKKFIDLWTTYFQRVKEVKNKEFERGVVSFTCLFERVFGYLLRLATRGVDLKRLNEFFNMFLPNVNPSEFAVQSVEDVLKCLGMIRYVHLVHNYAHGEIHTVYYFSNNLYFEGDIVFIQSMVLLINKEDLFGVLVKNFFSYCPELISFFEDSKSIQTGDRFRAKVSLIEDFLDFLIFIMTDEICLLNICFTEKDPQAVDEEFTKRVDKVFRRLLISILSGHYWIEGNALKRILKEFLFLKEKEVHMAKIFAEVAIIDKKNKKMRIKDDQVQKFDPYLMFRKPNIQKQVTNEVIQKSKTTDIPIDIVGGQSYQEYPPLLS